MTLPRLAIILPCYNEDAVLLESQKLVLQKLEHLINVNKIRPDSYVLFVDDGSTDKSWDLIESSCKNTLVKGLKLSRNFGHQNALLAGMEEFVEEYDIVITIDADLQDDIDVMEKMIVNHSNGDKIVLGVRGDRTSDSFFKRNTAILFYKLMSALKVSAVFNHADFRLLDKEAVRHLSKFKERNLFLRGIVMQIGLPTSQVYYARKERTAGETKYPLKKMMGFALQGITSFSAYPLRLIFYTGMLVFVMSVALVVWALYQNFTGNTIPGWASIVIPVFVFSGIQMICLGIIGEYLGKIFEEIKNRPRYIVEKKK